ncbi:uncharacterized protein LOC116308332 isoform X1 [Actinia tenebrosa]|uniref:Uncharacterized protein LOC116308332 isoform X1 n=1 Tax=Actinia tenebrosa TaxID=6105 RepID=A0A6P8J4M0_ACTTE|nr:uncharacterized protein LOC116308332 isoform X1 [Actinia tenebrosa]
MIQLPKLKVLALLVLITVDLIISAKAQEEQENEEGLFDRTESFDNLALAKKREAFRPPCFGLSCTRRRRRRQSKRGSPAKRSRVIMEDDNTVAEQESQAMD